MLSNINALEEFPRQIARGRRTEKIGDHQSNRARYPESHGCYFQFQPVFYRRLRLTAFGQSRRFGGRLAIGTSGLPEPDSGKVPTGGLLVEQCTYFN